MSSKVHPGAFHGNHRSMARDTFATHRVHTSAPNSSWSSGLRIGAPWMLSSSPLISAGTARLRARCACEARHRVRVLASP